MPPDSASDARPFQPRNPETFFAAQRRNRRATRRMSALGIFAAMIMGVPLTLVLTPLIYAGTLLMAEIINHFSPLPPEFWQSANDVGQLASRVGNYFFNHRGTLDTNALIKAIALFLLPGMVMAFVLWLTTVVLFRRGGVGGALASMQAREPNQADLKELQLADVVQEMAIAAGLPAPKLMLVDSSGANAAAIGTSPADARIVISRRLIDDLDRDQLQALLAHLVGSIGNGDLRIAFTVTSVFETCGLLVAIINSPFGHQSRSAIWRMVRYTFSRGSSDSARAVEAEAVASMLAGGLDMNSTDVDRFFNKANPGLLRKFFRLVFFPILFTNMAVELTLWFFLGVVVGPCMALIWRTRRYLADASAVELTRNPDALAGALQRLSEDNSAIPGGTWATHLFVINPQGDHTARDPQVTPEQLRQAAEVWAGTASSGGDVATGPGPIGPGISATVTAYSSLRSEIMAAGLAAARGDAQAAARMQAFMQAMAAAHGEDAAQFHMPNLADVTASRHGDREAIARLQAQNQQERAQRQDKHGETGLQAQSFLSFHPPLKKRLKRLEKMGARFSEGAHARMSVGARVVMAVLFVVIVPLLAVAAAGMLVVIAMMIMLNLVFLSLWLAVIHAIFVWLNARWAE